MVKLKLKMLRSCRSKHPSTLPDHHPDPILHRNNNNNSNNNNIITIPPHQQQQSHRSSFKTHISSVFGCGSKSDSDYCQWQEDDQWHVVAKIYDVDSPRRKIYNSSVADTDDDSFPFPLPLLPPVDKKKRRRGRQRLRHVSTSSDGRVMTSPESGSPARLSVFKKLLPCEVAGKMKESFAMVKRSEDPYGDFKRSMMEMVMEKEMFEEGDLEQLLQCYLSLNYRVHHGVIVQAFSEIWDTMFGNDGQSLKLMM